MLVGHYLRARADQITAREVDFVLGNSWIHRPGPRCCLFGDGSRSCVAWDRRRIDAPGLQPWAADLITGIVCIAVVAAGLLIVSVTQQSAALRKRRDDYEHFRARYRAKFGRSFDDAKRDS